MSLTVVCATMLGAITCKQLRRETMESSHGDAKQILSEKSCLLGDKKFAVGPQSQNIAPTMDFPTVSATELFCKLASMAPAAVKSSIFCTCETSGSNSLTSEFLECKVCRVSCCRNCICATSGYNLSFHETVDVHISVDDHDAAKFLSMLRQTLPPSLVFNKEGIDEISSENGDVHRVSGLSAYKFSLHRIERDRKKWCIIFYARDNGVNSVGNTVAEFRITVGELYRQTRHQAGETDLGMKGELTSFFPAKTEPLVFGKLDPCAVVTVMNGSTKPQWTRSSKATTASLMLKGDGAGDSFRAEIGLTDEAARSLVEASLKDYYKKDVAAAKRRNEQRRWQYPKNWKVWPENIHVECAGSGNFVRSDVFGTYKRAQCRQTTNQSALWIKEGSTENEPCLYIVVKPNVNRTGPDTTIVTSSISHLDSSAVIAVLPWTWQPCDALNPKFHVVNNVQMQNCVSV